MTCYIVKCLRLNGTIELKKLTIDRWDNASMIWWWKSLFKKKKIGCSLEISNNEIVKRRSWPLHKDATPKLRNGPKKRVKIFYVVYLYIYREAFLFLVGSIFKIFSEAFNHIHHKVPSWWELHVEPIYDNGVRWIRKTYISLIIPLSLTKTIPFLPVTFFCQFFWLH